MFDPHSGSNRWFLRLQHHQISRGSGGGGKGRKKSEPHQKLSDNHLARYMVASGEDILYAPRDDDTMTEMSSSKSYQTRTYMSCVSSQCAASSEMTFSTPDSAFKSFCSTSHLRERRHQDSNSPSPSVFLPPEITSTRRKNGVEGFSSSSLPQSDAFACMQG